MSATVSPSQNSQSPAKMPSMAPAVMNSNSMNPTPNRSGKSQKIFFLVFKDSKKPTKNFINFCPSLASEKIST